VALIETCGQQWFTRQQDLFKPTVLARLQQHLAQHHKIVLVSGSLLACLSPIAQQVGAHDILCIQQAQQEGIFTGEIVPPQTIGEGKAVAIKQYLAQQPTDDKHTTVYGDHISDLPMLSLADMPVVVANCPQLIAVAKEAGWEQL